MPRFIRLRWASAGKISFSSIRKRLCCWKITTAFFVLLILWQKVSWRIDVLALCGKINRSNGWFYPWAWFEQALPVQQSSKAARLGTPASGSSSRRRVQTSQARLNQLPAPNRHPLVATRSDNRSHKKNLPRGERKLEEGSGSSLVSSCKALTNRASVTRFLSFLSVVYTTSKN